nr:immunoglobulin light chain junction region [Macaca mulatta]
CALWDDSLSGYIF